MSDVAAAAGLSRATVSKYFNGRVSLKPATRARIEQACQALQYVPDPHAVSLAKGKSALIGVVLPVIADPFYGELLRHMEDHAALRGLQLVIQCSYNNAAREEAALRAMRAMKVQGVVLTAVASARNLAFLGELGQEMPLVFADSYVQPDCHFAMNDNAQSMGMLVDYLLHRGYPPAYLSAPGVARPSHEERLQAYTQRMAQAGEKPRIIPVPAHQHTWDFEGFAFEHVSRWLSQGHWLKEGVSAVLCATDRLALGAMSAFRQFGLQPGVDVLFAGHDDVPMSAYLQPALTTARQDLAAIGQTAIEVLLNTSADTLRAGGYGQHRFPAQLIVRESA